MQAKTFRRVLALIMAGHGDEVRALAEQMAVQAQRQNLGEPRWCG